MPKQIPVTVRATVHATLDQTFNAAMPVDLTKIFTGFMFLPAIVNVENQSGSWDHVGVSRNPVFSNGKGAFEQITTCNPPTYFDYDVTRFTNVLRRLVSGAHGSWTFTRDKKPSEKPATVIEWTYSFAPLRFRRSIVRVVIAPAWRGYMRRALALTVREVEKTVSAESSDSHQERP